jgi:hypothetical protein
MTGMGRETGMLKTVLAASAMVLIGATAPSAPTAWQPPRVSSDQFEAYAAFDPINGDLWFVRSKPDFTGWRIKVSRCGCDGWQEPMDAPIAGDGVEADPIFADHGRSLWFISNRSTDGIKRTDMDIWRVSRGRDGKWGMPQRLPAPINSTAQEWFPRFAPDGWLYFGSGRPGGLGKTDIWRARQDRGGTWTVENAGPAINSAADEYEPLISPDGKTMLLGTGDGYYISKWTARGWSARVKLGAEINLNGSETGATYSPTGKSWLFGRDAKDGKSGEFFLAGDREANWPPACPARI